MEDTEQSIPLVTEPPKPIVKQEKREEARPRPKVKKARRKRKKRRKIKLKLKSSLLKYFLIAVLSISALVFLVYIFVQNHPIYQSNSQRMVKIGNEILDLRSAMNIDSFRQHKMQKIMGIVKTYNSNLNSSELYDIANEIYEMSVKYSNLDVDLLCAVITHESALTWDPDIVSNAGAMGLMQIMPVTGMFLAQCEDIPWTTPEKILFNPIYNIRMGSRYLSVLMEQYGIDGGLAAYNGGEKQAYLWLKNDRNDQYLFAETQVYIPAVKKLYNEYIN